MLGTEGWAGTTVRAVCQRSKLNPRYFYESFDDLDALVVAVYDHVVEQLRRELGAALASAPPEPEAQIRASVGRIVRFIDEDRRRARVLYVEALGNEALNRRRVDTGLAVVGFAEQLTASGRRAKASEHVRRMNAAIVVGGLSELLVAWIEGRIDVSRQRLIDDATEMFLALADSAAAIAARRAR